MVSLIDYIRSMMDVKAISSQIEDAPEYYKRDVIHQIVDKCAIVWCEQLLDQDRGFDEVYDIIDKECDLAEAHFIMDINEHLSTPLTVWSGEYLH